MKIVILGSGVAGSIASGALFGEDVSIYDQKAEVSSTHSAVMRLRDPEIGNIVKCNITKIHVLKQIYSNDKLYTESSIKMNNQYSLKTSGEIKPKSINTLGWVERYLADDIKPLHPVNTHHTVSRICDGTIHFANGESTGYDVCISTIPMPSLLKATGYQTNMDFGSRPISVLRGEIPLVSDVHQTVYVPSPDTPLYRITLEGRIIIAESMEKVGPEHVCQILRRAFGIPKKISADIDWKHHTHKHGKLMSTDEEERQAAIYNLTLECNIFSLGRYAVWRPIRADHLIKDIKIIKTLINIRRNKKYEYKKSLMWEGGTNGS